MSHAYTDGKGGLDSSASPASGDYPPTNPQHQQEQRQWLYSPSSYNGGQIPPEKGDGSISPQSIQSVHKPSNLCPNKVAYDDSSLYGDKEDGQGGGRKAHSHEPYEQAINLGYGGNDQSNGGEAEAYTRQTLDQQVDQTYDHDCGGQSLQGRHWRQVRVRVRVRHMTIMMENERDEGDLRKIRDD